MDPVHIVHALLVHFGMNDASGVNTPPGDQS